MTPRRWLAQTFRASTLGLVAVLACGGSAAPVQYLTEPVTRGSIADVVSATGQVSALIKVNVGSQVSGTIARLLVDFNSTVRKDQLIAEIDPRLFVATLQRSEAAVAVADAAVDKAKVAVLDADRTAKRLAELRQRNMIAQADVDTAEVNQAAATAGLKGAQAQLLQARADRDVAAANLAFTKIRSPIDGIVIDRQVDVGQTVAASFQVQTLFVIANDLSRMRILADIDEADIGKVKEGMPARFTVDAYPNQTFEARIKELRQAPASATTSSTGTTSATNTSAVNVVTYAAVIDADNPDHKLRQGMTAHVSVMVSEHKNVLRVPAAALRYKPSTNDKTHDDAPADHNHSASPAGGAAHRDTDAPPDPDAPRTARLYRLEDKKPAVSHVHVGLSDGHNAEVIDGVEEGQEVIIGEVVHTQTRRRGMF